jgi:predicted MFS family arabinose efflux permease
MATLAETVTDVTDDRLAARNALVLAAAQALAGGNNTVIVATGGIVGTMLAPDPALATVPISLMVVGMWIGTLPVGMLAKAFGRRFALQTGTAFGTLSGVLACAAVLLGSFTLFLVGTLCAGLYAAAHQSYRFAAADTASPHFRPRAIAWVLAGGVFAGVIGPQLVIFTKDAWPAYLFAGTFLAQSACAVAAGAVLTFLKLPKPATARPFADGRPLAEVVRQPRYIVAVACGLASYRCSASVGISRSSARPRSSPNVTARASATRSRRSTIFLCSFGSFLSGLLLTRYGWGAVNEVVFPVLITAGVLLAWGSLIRRPDPV